MKTEDYFGIEGHEDENKQEHRETSRELKKNIDIDNNVLKLRENTKEIDDCSQQKKENNTIENKSQSNEVIMTTEIKNNNKENVGIAKDDNENEKEIIKLNNFIGNDNIKLQTDTKLEENKPKFISLEDYESLEPLKLFCDKRPFLTMFKDLLIQDHSLISLIFKRSLFDPFFIRLAKFVFEIHMQFVFNAVLFDDSLIEARIDNVQAVYIFLK
jgi:hypothetical protein